MEEKKQKVISPGMLGIMGVTAILITAAGIIYKQSPLRMIPLYVSLVIALMQSGVSRYAPLIGSVNALLYAAVYGYYRLYASMAYAALVSCPLQVVTFINWSRKPWKGSTILKKLTNRQRILIFAGSAALWAVVVFALGRTGSEHRILDTTSTILGILATILTMLSYIEYTVVMLAGQVCSIGLYIAMLGSNPEQLTYLIYSVYAMVCTTAAFIRTREIYKIQQKSKNEKEN